MSEPHIKKSLNLNQQNQLAIIAGIALCLSHQICREPPRSPKFPKEDDQNDSLAQLCLYSSLPINHVISVAVGCPRTLIRMKYTGRKTMYLFFNCQYQLNPDTAV